MRPPKHVEDKQADEWLKEWESFWKPLLMTKGKFDEKKIIAEMHDLVFIYKQVSEVYCAITGNKLSKPMYYAKTIISEYEEQLQNSYDEGYNDAKQEDE